MAGADGDRVIRVHLDAGLAVRFRSEARAAHVERDRGEVGQIGHEYLRTSFRTRHAIEALERDRIARRLERLWRRAEARPHRVQLVREREARRVDLADGEWLVQRPGRQDDPARGAGARTQCGHRAEVPERESQRAAVPELHSDSVAVDYSLPARRRRASQASGGSAQTSARPAPGSGSAAA